jgi:hypothetical protein
MEILNCIKMAYDRDEKKNILTELLEMLTKL